MKVTGIVRQVDTFGRVVLPRELRNILDIRSGDPIEINVVDGEIILKKYQVACIFTGALNDLMDFHGLKVSREAARELADLEKSTRSIKRKLDEE